jgi:hypothetical protein
MKHPAQERDLVPGRAIAGISVGVIAATVAGVLVAWGILRCDARDVEDERLSARPGEVIEEVNAMERALFQLEAQGLEMNARAAAYLSSYGWVDRDRGLVRIPIHAAFRVLLERQGDRP